MNQSKQLMGFLCTEKSTKRKMKGFRRFFHGDSNESFCLEAFDSAYIYISLLSLIDDQVYRVN
ncbi:hypothetical protein HanXRQr2_Chr03g0108171 [Helianthus annuus]|uniref:Uncharacterized protein n=1 Tax=Helianthus annuus TaxID=4232 RepID=A0A9K3JGN0_HELAN|nr:hypothetical protein HanXRQr2_Chr03g0108171 [Helianthus annuus]KAJ0943444.1 hypothetical protein HanPSC8_Chr03g0104671 [Helianthus annuus]